MKEAIFVSPDLYKFVKGKLPPSKDYFRNNPSDERIARMTERFLDFHSSIDGEGERYWYVVLSQEEIESLKEWALEEKTWKIFSEADGKASEDAWKEDNKSPSQKKWEKYLKIPKIIKLMESLSPASQKILKNRFSFGMFSSGAVGIGYWHEVLWEFDGGALNLTLLEKEGIKSRIFVRSDSDGKYDVPIETSLSAWDDSSQRLGVGDTEITTVPSNLFETLDLSQDESWLKSHEVCLEVDEFIKTYKKGRNNDY